jgi:hypothetical protein
MVISEKEKFYLLLEIIRKTFSVRVKERLYRMTPDVGKPGKIHNAIDGYCNYIDGIINMTLIPDMTEEEWSEAGAVLLHEMGHCINMTTSETKAWKNAEKWLKNLPALYPLRFEEIRKHDLELYKIAKDAGNPAGVVFSY